MSVQGVFEEFNADGEYLGAQFRSMPEFLDWMPISVKHFWFTSLGQGDPSTKYVLIKSQGEQHLYVLDRPLEQQPHKQYMEKLNDLESAVQSFIDREGINRTPRNQ